MANLPFTGEDDGTDNPIQSILGGARNVGQGINDTLFRDPESRSALLQIGLGLMQPMAQGQTTLGHIGQAVGGGGEALHRIQEEDVKQQKADDALTIAEQRMQLAQQRADRGLTPYQTEMLKRHDIASGRAEAASQRGERRLDWQMQSDKRKALATDVANAIEARDSLTLDEKDPEKMRWAGKSSTQIRQELKAEQDAASGGGGAPAATSAVPPPEKREANKVYPTPKGNLKWTGTGWVQP
jgi:hypothetical protein